MTAGVCNNTHQTHKLRIIQISFTHTKNMDAIAGDVLQGLTSLALGEFKLLWNAKNDVERMKNTILAIRATLLDAEAKANNNHQVTFWLARLKDALYNADELLDDLSTEALRREVMTQNKVAKKVRIFFSKSNQLVYKFKMAHKLREVRGSLDEIDSDKRQFHLADHPLLKPLPVLEERKQTHSFVQEDEIIGREEEKDFILHNLLDSNVESSVSVIPIVGFGGLGKTALAQLVYNHEDVQKYFGLKKWVCVSDVFDVRQIAQKILGQENPKEMELVQQDLRTLIGENRFLMVLDDVWDDNFDVCKWRELRRLLTNGVEGNMIIVTTRSEKVGKIMCTYRPFSEKVGKMTGTYRPIVLKGLDGERSWELFCRMAFVGGIESSDKELLAIGREVVKKCAGVPLAIKVVGSLVYDKTLEGINLSCLRNCELWNIDQLDERVFAVLKLSYDHLPAPLKNCVAFCSLFPKDFLFEKQTLIQMWVAEGFIQPTDQMSCEEDIGHEFFMNLLSRSFFQDVIRDHYGNVVKCKMHDLIHDLAQFIAKDEYVVIRERKEKNHRNTTRHLSYVPRDNWEVPTSFLKFEKLRTMLLLDSHCFYRMDDYVFDLAASKLKCLRVLDLHRSNLTEIPTTIGKLKHLRFLDLSCNYIKKVPRAIVKLHNLQTLNLGYNFTAIQELPRDISKLVSLRHLHLTKCWWLEWMPSGLGKLTSLQTLTHFVVDDQEMQWRRGSARISELGELKNLRGSLTIRGLKHLRSNPEEAESAKLKEKQHLQSLYLVWDTLENEDAESSKVASDELVLEKLSPHHTIKGIVIERFCGERLPDWIVNLLELQYLVLLNCEYLMSLPEGLSNLISLLKLTIRGSPWLPGEEWQKIAHMPCFDPFFRI